MAIWVRMTSLTEKVAALCKKVSFWQAPSQEDMNSPDFFCWWRVLDVLKNFQTKLLQALKRGHGYTLTVITSKLLELFK